MSTTVEDFRCFSVHDLKRLGMLRDGYNGGLKWPDNNGGGSTIVLTVQLYGDTPTILLQYTITKTGESVADRVNLYFQKSNLPGHTGGHWIFICPVTGHPCRVLYLDSGHFKSRKALPRGTIYKCQTHTVYFRTICRTLDYFDAMVAMSETLQQPYSKEVYRGKPTRRAKQGMKKVGRYDRAMNGWLMQQERQK